MNNYKKNYFSVLLLWFFSFNAFAVTVDAGDYTRLPVGTNFAVLYSQHTRGESFFDDGNEILDNAQLDADVQTLRLVRFIDVGGLTVAPQFLLPYGEVKTGGDIAGLDSANGIGDLIINPTIHLKKFENPRQAFAFTPWLFLPTGDYDREKDINALGENRYRLTLQLGYLHPINSKWTVDVLGDVTFFGENDDFTSAGSSLKQDELYEFQTHLRYHITPGSYVAGLLSHSWGGETEIDGVKQNNKQRITKTLLTYGTFVSPSVQVIASYGRDISRDEGVAEDHRFNIRLLKVF